MTPLAAELTLYLAVGTVVAQIATVAILVLLVAKENKITRLLREHGLLLAFFVALGASAITLVYSEVFGFAPCGLCWLQRVFLYPQVVLLGIALWKKESRIADYSLGLSVLGGLVALYQHYLQMGGVSVLPCPSAGAGTDCAQRFVFEFGYITFPLMAATVFALIAVLMLLVRNSTRWNTTSSK